MSIRVRFAPSPTGQVHIGNIRAAIFNWLYARHVGGTFLLRVEDTDLERSTPQAIAALLEVMEWLGLDYDEPIFYQTTQAQKHIAAAREMLAKGFAYEDKKGGDTPALLFQFPYDTTGMDGIEEAGIQELALHESAPLKISRKGVDFATVSPKGRPAPGGATLAGFKDLKAFDAEGKPVFDLNEHLDEVLKNGAVFELPDARKITYLRRTISYTDLVKGRMTKPLDALKDFVIVRSDGSPVFHLANVIDDITQGVTHIIRGDDHVENTFKHLFLFHALGAPVPQYAHLPMIINAQGKPYSKRDGDAFVGDFRDKGFLADALFNYLSLLGWSPGDDREKMSRSELIEAFTLERCLRGPSQMDIQKLTNLNGQYIAELPAEQFQALAKSQLATLSWADQVTSPLFEQVALFMQSRVKRLVDVAQWEYFFTEYPTWDATVCEKLLGKNPAAKAALALLPERFIALPEWNAAAIEQTVEQVAEQAGILHGKLNQPLRAAVTGTNIGAGIFETLELIGRERTVKRLEKMGAEG
ncbi:MAG: glutamate--tRNA ligase [Victivallales bacterium]|nr:glutamate--tRNA ligase [Victivallales bacterium]